MLRILGLEPHGDDGCCSFTSVLRSDNEIDLITFAVRPSYGLEEFYSSIKGNIFLDYEDLNFYERPKVTTHEIHNLYLSGEVNVMDYYRDKVKGKFNNFNDSVMEIASCISDKVSDNKYDILLCPVGLTHPYHIAVNEAIMFLLSTLNCEVVFYVDKPYLSTRYAKEMYEHYRTKSQSNKYLEINSPNVDKELEIREVLKEIYPTEQNMLRFSSDILLNSVDKYLINDYGDIELTLKFKESLR